MALEIWETLKESITAYTGLSPAAFFTVVALGVVTYYLVSSFFYSSPSDHAHHERSRDFEEMEPLPPPVQLGEITAQQLKEYDGSDPKKPLLMAIKAQIYDVTQSRVFYGPGGPYSLFAGKDASRALAKMSFEESDLTSDISGLGSFELDALQDWEYKFMSKYTKVGTVKSEVPVTEGPTDAAATEEEVPNLIPIESAEEAKPVEADEVNEAHVADNHVTKPVEADEVNEAHVADNHVTKPVEAAEVNEEGHVAKPVEAVEVKKEAHIKPVEDSPSEASA